MNTLQALFTWTAALLAVSSCAQVGLHSEKTVNINVIVTDTTGSPIEQALVLNGREINRPVHKFTGEDGVARFERVGQGYFNPHIVKNGYYAQLGHFHFRIVDPGVEREYRVVLKPVLDPVPIEEEELRRLYYPLEWEEKGGFDLEKLDFVAPCGKGVVTDLVFKTTWRWEDTVVPGQPRRIVSQSVMSVIGEHDGLYPFKAIRPGSIAKPASMLMPPNQFPSNGFVRSVEYSTTHQKGFSPTSIDQENHVAFRVRTQLNENGAVESCHVGWMEGPILLQMTQCFGKDMKQYDGVWDNFKPEWGLVAIHLRHWNPVSKSLSLETDARGRWENSLPKYIKMYELETLPGIEKLQRLPKDHPQFRPTQEEQDEQIRKEYAEKKKEWERKRAEAKKPAPTP